MTPCRIEAYVSGVGLTLFAGCGFWGVGVSSGFRIQVFGRKVCFRV